MSQDTFSIANSAGAVFRAANNASHQAHASTNKGGSRPATPYTGQLWLDDDTPSSSVWSLFMYDGSDDIEVGKFDITNNRFIPKTAQSADLASASTLNLDSVYGHITDVTGTTTITAITLAQGSFRIVRFTGALVLTHGSSLVIPGAQNITTAAGDFAVVVGYASSVVRIVSYARATGQGISITGAEATIASATTTDLGTIAGNLASVTGTTTITGLGSSASTANPLYFLRFTGILLLTYNASSLILPGSANITTQAGDTAIFKYEGSGNWRCIHYLRRDGTAVGAISLIESCKLLSTQTANGSSANLDFTSIITSDYSVYIFEIEDLRPSVTGSNVLVRSSVDNGANFDAGGTNYSWSVDRTDFASHLQDEDITANSLFLTGSTGAGNQAASALSGSLKLHNANSAVAAKRFSWVVGYKDDISTAYANTGVGVRLSNTAINAIRFLVNTGVITSGKIRCYGFKAA